ncbi:MAG TPA: hypothetical protein ENI23_06970 [bacterium]|nr:hypothetical protein [bacterium]
MTSILKGTVKCEEEVRDQTGWHYFPCSYWATVERDGQKYCNRHDPVRRAKVEEEKMDKWHEELRAKRRLSRGLTDKIISFLEEGKKKMNGQGREASLLRQIRGELDD